MKRGSLVPAKNKRVLGVCVHLLCDLCAVLLVMTISSICYANYDTSFVRMPAHLKIDAGQCEYVLRGVLTASLAERARHSIAMNTTGLRM